MKFILAKKLGMTTIYENDGTARNVTMLETGTNVVTQIRNNEKDGYSAVQVGFLKEGKKVDDLKDKKINSKDFDSIGEFRFTEGEELKDVAEKSEIKIDQFQPGEKVKIVGISKGKGYQGVMKRHGFSGSPASHGHRHDHRAPGSIGCGFPERVLKGKRMAGRMGSEQVTIEKIKIAYIDAEKGLLGVEGSVPGNAKQVVKIIG